MQIPVSDILPIIEKGEGLAFFDTESSGTHADYNTLLVGTVKPYKRKPITFVVNQLGHDQRLARELRDCLTKFPVWVSYYGKGHDIPLVNGRLLYHGLGILPRHHHIDLYYVLRYGVKTSRHSQAHLLEWLGTKQKKLTLSPSVWNLSEFKSQMETLRKRCESDCAGLEALYERSKHLIREITR